MNDVSERFETLERLAEDAAEEALSHFRGEFGRATKAGPMDLVTDADHAVQRLVVDRLGETYPADPVVGEEEGAVSDLPSGDAWVVDPIDGTANFAAGNRVWAVSLAAVRDRRPIAAVNALPALGDTYAAGEDRATRNGEAVSVSETATVESLSVGTIYGRTPRHRRGLRRAVEVVLERFGVVRHHGSGQTTLSLVAAGELDAAVSTVPLDPWDSVAGVHLVRRAGGTVTDLEGDPWTPDASGLLASNGHVHDALTAAFEPTP